jgi:polar amino acid transport system substrate-binding protein
MKPVFIPLPAERLTDALLTGKVDMLMAGLTITDTRRLQMDFSLPYLVVGQAALIRSEDLLRYNTDLKIRSTRCRIGLLADSPAEELVDTYFSPAVRLVFARPAEGAGALEKQQIDIFMHDAPAVWWLAGQSKGRLIVAPPLFAREELAWGFRRSSNALREAANQVLAEWRQDGTLEAVLQRWLPVSR